MERNNEVQSMSSKDRQALVTGIILGIISGVLTFGGALVAGLVFIVCSFLSPLIVSLIAQDRIMTLSQVPNLLMTLTATILMVSFFGYHSMVGRYDSGELLLGVLVILLMAVIPALAISALVKWIRRKRAAQ
jgi:ABC-type amino acid transport system permease subunit